MKYLLIVIVVITLVMLSVTNYKLHNIKKENDLIKIENGIFKNDIEIYLKTLFDPSLEKPLPDVSLFSDSIFHFNQINKKVLVYFFSHEECNSCVEQHILDIRQTINKIDSASVIIISDNRSEKFNKMMARIYNSKKINFGILLKNISTNKSCYFIVSPGDKISNIFYPAMNNTESSIMYLKHAVKFLNWH